MKYLSSESLQDLKQNFKKLYQLKYLTISLKYLKGTIKKVNLRSL